MEGLAEEEVEVEGEEGVYFSFSVGDMVGEVKRAGVVICCCSAWWFRSVAGY